MLLMSNTGPARCSHLMWLEIREARAIALPTEYRTRVCTTSHGVGMMLHRHMRGGGVHNSGFCVGRRQMGPLYASPNTQMQATSFFVHEPLVRGLALFVCFVVAIDRVVFVFPRLFVLVVVALSCYCLRVVAIVG